MGRLTAEDLVVRASADPASAREHLAQAAEIAAGVHELRAVLQAEAALGASEALWALAARTLDAAEHDELEQSHGFVDVARILVDPLGDREGAAAALRRGEAHLGRPSDWTAPVWGWCDVARAWVELLGARADAERCLGEAEAACEGAHDFGIVAEARQELGDEAGARGLAERAEAVASPAEVWTVANGWRALGDDAAADEALRGALARATLTDEAIVVARAWASHERPDEAASAVRTASELARTAGEHFDVARLCHELGQGAGAVRASLQQAGALVDAEDLSLRTEITTCWSRWLGEAWSSPLALAGVRPSALHRLPRPLPGVAADADALFDRLRERIDEPALRRIAAADYGAELEEHLAALRQLCASGLLPPDGVLPWHPHEVLALTRWARGERVDHLGRLFATTVLALLPGAELDSIVPYLVDSALALGGELPPLAQTTLAALRWRDDPSALLGLALLRMAARPDDEVVPVLLDLAAERMDGFLEYSSAATQWADLTRAVAGQRAGSEAAERLLGWLAP
ncbi:MAG: hypothetical protein R3F59_38665 [Myxococcota bacterium]